MIDVSIEKLIPHRGRMKLPDKIIEVNGESAVTLSIVKNVWPLVKDEGVSPLVLIELAAQTAAVAIGWQALQEKGSLTDGSGLLVGVKTAEFHIDAIPVNACILTRSSVRFSMDAYTEITGTSTWNGKQLSDVTLQVIRTDEENEDE